MTKPKPTTITRLILVAAFVLAAVTGASICDTAPARADVTVGSAAVVAPDAAPAPTPDAAVQTSAPAGSGSAAGSAAAPAPTAAQLHDPTTDPVAAIQDVRALKARWPLLVLAILIALTKVVHLAGDKLGAVGAWLKKGRRAMVLAAIGSTAAACFDAIASGGSWSSVLLVAGAALLALLSPHGAGEASK